MSMLESPMVQAAIATAFISVTPIAMLMCIFGTGGSKKKQQRSVNPHILRIFVCFAIGGLLGDAFLHLIPHAISPHSHDTSAPSPWMKQLEQWLHLSSNDSVPINQSTEPVFPVGASEQDADWLSEAHPHFKPLDKEDHLSHSHHDHDHDHDHDHLSHKHSHDDHHHHHHESDHSHSHSDSHDHDHSHGDEHRVGLLVLAGMGFFFVIEKFARLRAGNGGNSHGHSHSHGPAKRKHSHDVDETLAKHVSQLRMSDNDSGDEIVKSSLKQRKNANKQTPIAAKTVEQHIHDEDDTSDDVTENARLTGLLNLIADLSHNFTDGLAIAASFLSSPALGLSTTIAVCVHEIPHEIGDFAILIQAGYSMKQAIVFQLYTAVGAMFGVGVIAVMGADDSRSLDWVLPVTAGGFVYVALINVAPAILNEQPRIAGEHWSGVWLRSIAEIGAILAGVGLMILIGQLE